MANDTLKKIEYESLEQLLIDINHNFAVVQNSPLYKGVPGKDALPGDQGLRGIRGTQFFFVNFAKFSTQFPNEFINASAINLNYINSKLLSFPNKQKLLLALGATEFVDKDIVVLTNSMMLSYDIALDVFIDTKLAFNEQTNLLSSIENQIETYVQFYIEHNSTLLGLKNIFQSLTTYAKNYADTSNVYITNQQTASSVYVPYYPGLTSDLNGTLVNHKYFGFSDSEFPRTDNGTIVIGSMKKYIDLLVATVSTVDGVTLTSDYAPGANNIPSAVFMQDTPNAGIMFGRKSNSNLRAFGHIYKNILDEIVIQSDSGPYSSSPSLDFSKLIISKLKMTFDKKVIFGDDLTIVKNHIIIGNINSPQIKTNTFTTEDKVDCIEIGSDLPGAKYRNLAEYLRYTKYLSKVLITDSVGTISKNYSLETMSLNLPDEVGFNAITTIPTLATKLVTSNYIGFLSRKINNIQTKISSDYYTKVNFTDGSIPTLVLSQFLEVSSDAYLGGTQSSNLLKIIKLQNLITIGRDVNSQLNISGDTTLSKIQGKVLVTDPAGKIISTYSNSVISPTDTVPDSYAVVPNSTLEVENLIPANIGTRDQFKILSGLQNKWIINVINAIKTRLKNTFNKTESDSRYGQRLVFTGKFNGNGTPNLMASRSSLTGYMAHIQRPNGGVGDYKIYFSTNSGTILSLSNYYVLATSFDGGNIGENTVGISKCSIGSMTIPTVTIDGQINITTGDDPAANDCIFEIYVYEFLI